MGQQRWLLLWRKRSIATRLAVFALFWSFLILLAAGFILARLYRINAEHNFDERLLLVALDLTADMAVQGEGEKRELASVSDPRFNLPLSGWYWQITRHPPSSHDIQGSRSLVESELPFLSSEEQKPLTQERKGYVQGPDGRWLRVVERDIDFGNENRFIVSAAGPADLLDAERREFLIAMITTFLLLGLALALSTLLQIRFGLAPLTRLRAAITAIRNGERERVADDYPSDIKPLARELDLLLDSNTAILERARTQVGNLAHALKTPLSVMMNEASQAPDELKEKLQEQSLLMREYIDHYLARARVAALAGSLNAVTPVEPVLTALMRTFTKIYAERNLTLSLTGDVSLRFRGERQDLEEMLGCLIDNACKWAKSHVSIHVQRENEGHIMLIIADDGPGMPDEILKQEPVRGRRLDETKPGTGLGLSIVSDLASLYGGRLLLMRSDKGGLDKGGLEARLIVMGD
jgi:signal transduction histidine kinase